MWSPLADRPPRSVAPSSTSSSHQSARFGGIWIPTSGISRRHSRTSSFMSSSVIGVAQSGSGTPASVLRLRRRRPRRRVPAGLPLRARLAPMRRRHWRRHLRRATFASDARRPRPPTARGPLRRRSRRPRGRSSCGCGTKFWRITSWMWPWRSLTSASASSEAIRSSSVSPIPTRIPLVNGIRSSPAASIVSQALAPGASSASRRGPSPSVAPRSTRASAPARRSPLAAGPGPSRSGRPGSCAAGAPARARAHRPRRRRRRSRRGPRTRSRSATSGLTSGRSPVSTSSSLAFRRTASSSRRSTSSGA